MYKQLNSYDTRVVDLLNTIVTHSFNAGGAVYLDTQSNGYFVRDEKKFKRVAKRYGLNQIDLLVQMDLKLFQLLPN